MTNFLCSKIILRPQIFFCFNFFWTWKFSDPIFFRTKLFFSDPIFFFGPTIFFWPKILFRPKSLFRPIIFWAQIFGQTQFFSVKEILSDPNFFLPKILFRAKQIFLTLNELQLKPIFEERQQIFWTWCFLNRKRQRFYFNPITHGVSDPFRNY